jgi:hypothetical protein
MSKFDEFLSFLESFSDDEELFEQEAEGGTSTGSASSGGGTGKAVKTWASGRSFGKTYMNDPKYKWESGRTFGKTYMNDPKYKWESGRNFGKTGGSDFA